MQLYRQSEGSCTVECYLLSKLGVLESHSSMLKRRSGHTIVWKMSELWVAGGKDDLGLHVTSEIFKEGTWTKSIDLPTPLSGHCMLSLNETHHFLCGGYDGSPQNNRTYIFNNNTFTKVAGMATGRSS